MADANSYSGDEYSDDEEDGEELDPRVQVRYTFEISAELLACVASRLTEICGAIQLLQDELEKLNVAANSINHLEAELDVSTKTILKLIYIVVCD